MNRWADLNIPLPERRHFIGEKISISKVINKEIEIKELEVQLNNLTNNEEINHEDNG